MVRRGTLRAYAPLFTFYLYLEQLITTLPVLAASLPALARVPTPRRMYSVCLDCRGGAADELAAALRWATRLPSLYTLVLQAGDRLLAATYCHAAEAFRHCTADLEVVPSGASLTGQAYLREMCLGLDPFSPDSDDAA